MVNLFKRGCVFSCDHLPALSLESWYHTATGVSPIPGGGVLLNGAWPRLQKTGHMLTCALEALGPEGAEAGSIHHQHMTPL